ncbi:hypothetical protein SmJEL517_g01763 [Synchytrium microbalum]|uniref:G-patch domain-containing protein n=1 Tax=Synchytrium microbalum TaxID=1806994 RepID=A0A507C8I3_9FUNG|nr:uncharacterized protein SmJEL517_g01763 [Synchytrium microbalum]TPX35932.1 hypothetical protein SmJEL517_g01763 [Synchytrium microbalum]
MVLWKLTLTTILAFLLVIPNEKALATASGPRHKSATALSLDHTSTVVAASLAAAPSIVSADNTPSTHSLEAITTPVPDEIRSAALAEAHIDAVSRHLEAGQQKLYEQGYSEGYSHGYGKGRVSSHDRIVSFYGSGYLPDGTPCSGLCTWKTSDYDASNTHERDSGHKTAEKKVAEKKEKSRTDSHPDNVLGPLKVAGHQGL